MSNVALGFKLYQENPGVVKAAVYRAGIRRFHHDYDDWLERGLLLYIEYYQHYYDPLVTPADIIKFNHLAGHAIYWQIRRELGAEIQRHSMTAATIDDILATSQEPQILTTVGPHTDIITYCKQLWVQLTVREQQIFMLLYRNELPNRAIADQLNVSLVTVTRARSSIRRKYRHIKFQADAVKHVTPNAGGSQDAVSN